MKTRETKIRTNFFLNRVKGHHKGVTQEDHQSIKVHNVNSEIE